MPTGLLGSSRPTKTRTTSDDASDSATSVDAPKSALTDEQIAAARAATSFPEFLRAVRIVDVETHRVLRYRRWRHVLKLARMFEGGHSCIVLKARQLGITWLIAAYVLWACMYQDYFVALVISKDQLASNDVLRKAVIIYRNLPAYMRQPVTRLTNQTSGGNVIEFANGSAIWSQPATENAGRGITASLVVVDEAAFHRFAAVNYAAYLPTIGTHGQLLMVSTSAGPHGLFHALYTEAQRRANDYTAVFIPWWQRPDRSEPALEEDGSPVLDADGRTQRQPSRQWLARMKARFTGTIADFRHEYPATEGEAWSLQSGLVYGMDDDGTLVFDPRPYNPANPLKGGNISPDPCPWPAVPWAFAAIDWGGGHPTAVDIWGMLSSGRLHQFAELHATGQVGLDIITAFLQEWEPAAGFDAILCGAEEPVAIQTLRDHGFGTAKAATTARKEGFGVVSQWLRQRRITHNPETCPNSIAEYDSYYWAPSRDPISKETYATKTPVEHHGDHKDDMRYVVMEAQSLENQVMGDVPRVDVVVS